MLERRALTLDQWLGCELRQIEYLPLSQRGPRSYLSVPLTCPTLTFPLTETRTSIDLIIWTLVEAGAILIAACLPTLRPLFVLLIPRKFSRRASGPLDMNNSSHSSQS